jgi:2-methylcitrate dehydratase
MQALAASGTDEPTLAQLLAAYSASLQIEDIGAQTIEDAKLHLIDAIGCAIGALNERPIRELQDLIADTPHHGATVLGTGRRTTMELATFINGAAIRYFDYNDAYASKETGHPSDIISGILAVAEAEQKSGSAAIVAIVLAYEIDCHLLDTTRLSARGWDHPNFILPAAALAAGRLMELPPDALGQAVNLSLSGHLAMNQTRSQVISNWKAMAAAEAVRAGVFAAQLARAGISGPQPIFEGTAGFFKLVSGELQVDVTQFARDNGHFRISDCTIKLYPAQTQTLTAIAAALKIRRQIAGTSDIAAISVATTKAGMDYTANEPEKWAPKSSETADHSMPYIVARALSDGVITPGSYSRPKLQEAQILSLMAKLTVSEDPGLTAMLPDKIANRVSVTLRDGRVLSEQVEELPGFKNRPMQRSDIEDKFRRNVDGILPLAQQKAFLEQAWTLERQHNLHGLIKTLDLRRSKT